MGLFSYNDLFDPLMWVSAAVGLWLGYYVIEPAFDRWWNGRKN